MINAFCQAQTSSLIAHTVGRYHLSSVIVYLRSVIPHSFQDLFVLIYTFVYFLDIKTIVAIVARV